VATNSDKQLQRIKFFLKCLSDPDPQIREKAVTILGNCGAEIAIPELEKLVTSIDEDIQVRLKAMDAIVSIAKLELITSMSEQPKNQPTFNIGQVGNINTGDVTVQRDQVGIQNNDSTAPEIQNSIAEFQTILENLNRQHPTATANEAVKIINVEFQEIKDKQLLQWQNLLNIKRFYNGSKKAAIKIGEHFTETNVWGKGFIAFIEGISEDLK
jgi:HEAT repeats